MGRNHRIAVVILLFTIFSTACFNSDVDQGQVNKLRPEDNSNANVNVDPNSEVAEDNEDKLKSLINLPFEPEENVYRVEILGNSANNNRVPGPTDYKITAVLKFTEEDTQKLLEQLSANSKPFEAKLDAEPWFPAELIAKSQTSGDESIKGTGYKADTFFKPPYLSGTLTQVNGTDYFVVVLQTQ